MAQEIIADLNTSLSARDIRQLNEILDWAIFGYKYSTIDQIRAALWLSSGKLPVQPLERKLKENSGKVFSNLEDGTVSVPSQLPLLASYYSQFKDFLKARNVFRDDTVTSIAILEDDGPGNDSIGYETLAWILPHAGDDQYALSIRSLICPDTSIWSNDGQDDQEEYSIESTRNGPIKLSCEGACGKKWTYADDFYVCKSCDRIAFCSNCLEKLKRNRLARWNCRPEHSWLHIPPWKDDNEPGKGMIRVLDEAGSPKEVKISDWIKDLKRIWDIE
ncbi:hypothetical protein ACHAPF_002993 [Botrytis cinerea]